MKVFDFDIEKGIYSFEINDLKTEEHSHPVCEIIQATNGDFSILVDGEVHKNVQFAIIRANVHHKIISDNSTVKILMIESHNAILNEYLEEIAVEFRNDKFYIAKYGIATDLSAQIKTIALNKNLQASEDERVNRSLKYIANNQLEYKNLISILTNEVSLSESRLSHLFKQHTGVSIKKYLVWDKLRKAIKTYLNSQDNLTSVSIDNGFFDQAHLSNSFKNLLGVSPSKAYNSRILQS